MSPARPLAMQTRKVCRCRAPSFGGQTLGGHLACDPVSLAIEMIETEFFFQLLVSLLANHRALMVAAKCVGSFRLCPCEYRVHFEVTRNTDRPTLDQAVSGSVDSQQRKQWSVFKARQYQ